MEIFDLPKGDDVESAIRTRRDNLKAFNRIKPDLVSSIKNCATGQIPNDEFYKEMMSLWGFHSENRFQGLGFERSCKSADWRDVCSSLSKIVENGETSSVAELDNLVEREIDRLKKARNPTRHAWLSEMLCQFFLELYPVVDKPVKSWLNHNKFKVPVTGAEYIHLAQKLRLLVPNKVNGAKNLAELDYAIWKWWDNNR